MNVAFALGLETSPYVVPQTGYCLKARWVPPDKGGPPMKLPRTMGRGVH